MQSSKRLLEFIIDYLNHSNSILSNGLPLLKHCYADLKLEVKEKPAKIINLI